MKRLEFIEIDIDYCSLTYGTNPCTARGGAQCFNTKATCKARPAYKNKVVTLRFAVGAGYLSASGIDYVSPCVESISYSAGEISIGENMGKRASLSIRMSDFKYSDVGEGFDKYHATRPYDPYNQGMFWGRFRARQPYLRGRNIRWVQGHLGQTLDQMEVRHFIIDNFEGATLDGIFTITAKDVLKLADDDRVKVPVASRGYLLGDMSPEQTSVTIAPQGIGNIEYPAKGYINIAGKEICKFTRSGDVFTLERGQEGTLNVEHKAQDRIQLCKAYEGVDPADIIRDLLVTYAKIPSEYIPIADWRSETATYLRRRYTRIISDSMGVSKAISELIQQAGLLVWWDDATRLVRLKVIRAVDTDARIYNDENMLKGSFRHKERPDTRLSQVLTYFGKRSPLERDAEATSYHSLQMDVNLQAEADYGSSVIKTIHSAWVPQFGRAVAKRLNEIVLGRFVDPPREFSFSTFRSDDSIPPILGDGYRIFSRTILDASGLPAGVPVQVTKIMPKAEGYDVTAIEMTFEDFSDEDLNDRTIIIDGDYLNFNWRTAYDRIYPAPTVNDDIVCIISAGAMVGSQILGRPAFEVGNWPAGCKLRLIQRGRIQGRGGNGGQGGRGKWTHGEAGGTALYTRFPIKIEENHQIWGGGGGGGSGTWKYGGGGGGGQGFTAGLGGLPWNDDPQNLERVGWAGTRERFGAGGKGLGSDGEDGGAAGQKGKDSAGNSVSKGGAGGNSIDGNSYVTFVGGQGDIKGARVN